MPIHSTKILNRGPAHIHSVGTAPEGKKPVALWIALSVLLLGVGLAYSNSYSGPFVFDDVTAIPLNPAIRRFASVFESASSTSLAGRPFLALTFGLNYWLGGYQVWGYHLFNHLIQTAACLTLFGILRRTLLLPTWRARFGADATFFALACALWWGLHPLHTEAVTYTIQRAESLMGLLYLLTFYCFVRSCDSRYKRLWLAGSVLACLAGMGTKEVMVSAPLMVYLFDAAFVANGLLNAWNQRRGYYLALASTELLLAYLVISLGGNRGGSTGGFSTSAHWIGYWLTQIPAIATYLRLSFLPYPLVFDYGVQTVGYLRQVALSGLLVVALLAATVYLCCRYRPLGFLALFFWAILAPTSVMPGTSQMIVEHRMYLALIPIGLLTTCGLYRLGGRTALGCLGVAALGLGVATFSRNATYRSDEGLWRDTVAKAPANAHAYHCLGNVLAAQPNRLAEAVEQYRLAAKYLPTLAVAQGNLGNALAVLPGSNLAEALQHIEFAVQLDPSSPELHVFHGNVLAKIPGRESDACAAYRRALSLRSDLPEAHANLGYVLASLPGHLPEAIAEYRTALAQKPDFAAAHNNLGHALQQVPGLLDEAAAEFRRALQLDPALLDAYYNLASLLSDRPATQSEAVSLARRALTLAPQSPKAHYTLALALSRQSATLREAIAEFRVALKLDPGFVEAHLNLGAALLSSAETTSEAIAEFETVLRLDPNSAEAHCNLGIALANTGTRLTEALAHLQKAAELRPGDSLIRQNRDALRALIAASASRNGL